MGIRLCCVILIFLGDFLIFFVCFFFKCCNRELFCVLLLYLSVFIILFSIFSYS